MSKNPTEIIISVTKNFLERINVPYSGVIDESFVIYDNQSILDSLLAIQLIVEIEAEISKKLNKSISIFNETSFYSTTSNPYKSICSLSFLISEQTKKSN